MYSTSAYCCRRSDSPDDALAALAALAALGRRTRRRTRGTPEAAAVAVAGVEETTADWEAREGG